MTWPGTRRRGPERQIESAVKGWVLARPKRGSAMDFQKYRASDLEKARAADILRVMPRGHESVLEIGAFDGHFTRLLTQHFRSVTALDRSKPSFEHPGVVTVAGDVTRLEFADNSFDCVICTEVLEHIVELGKACQEVARVARHEIVIGVPFRQDIRVGRMTCSKCGKASPRWEHVNSFDEKRLLRLFSGLQVVSKSFVGANREATNWLSAALYDLAGNPWGGYGPDARCASTAEPRCRRPRGLGQ
jgi:SAM-dependent methyltransferase